MMRQVIDVARREYSVFDVLLTGVLLAALYAAIESVAVVAGVGVGLVVLALVNVATKLPTLSDRSVRISAGLAMALASGGWLIYEFVTSVGAESAIPAVLFVGSIWLVVQAFRGPVTRERPVADDVSSAEAMVRLQHARLVAKELRRGPKTVTELADDCDLTESRVRQALKMLEDDDAVYVTDHDEDESRYAVRESELGTMGFFRFVGERLLRPLSASR